MFILSCILMPKNCIRSEKVVKEEFEDTKMYQRGNHNPYIKEVQTTQWPKGQTTIYKTYT